MAYVYRVLVCLHDSPQYLASFYACFVDQPTSNTQKQRKCHRDHLIEISTNFSNLEPVYPAYCQQALYSGKDRACIVCAEELDGDVEEVRPLGGEVVGKDFLESWNELSAYLRGRGSEHRDETVSESYFLILWYWLRLSVILGRSPSFCDAILEVDDG